MSVYRTFLLLLCFVSFAIAQETPLAQNSNSVESESLVSVDSVKPAVEIQQAEPTEASRSSNEKPSSISVFVKSSEEIKSMQQDLINLQNLAGGSNASIDSLVAKASRIAAMNDRCSSISLNDVLDTTCSYFYEIELPAFENALMETTGEVRLGTMQMASTLEERTQQILRCTDALFSIIVPRDQLLRLSGNIYLEPLDLNGNFDAEYNYVLSYDPARMEQQERLANLWLSKCGDVVKRQTGKRFAPVFITSVKVKNDSLRRAGSNVKLLLNKDNLTIRADMRRSVKGSYFLNGEMLFSQELVPGEGKAHLRLDVVNKAVVLENGRDGVVRNFEGNLVFKGLKQQDMVGRWMWDAPVTRCVEEVLDESDMMTAEDSLVYEQVFAVTDSLHPDSSNQDLANAAANAVSGNGSAPEVKSSVHWIPLAISGALLVGGGIMAAVFNSKAKTEYDNYKSELDEDDDSKYQKHLDNSDSYQAMRMVGLGIAIAGGLGIGLSFAF